jgi:hypothetical protein
LLELEERWTMQGVDRLGTVGRSDDPERAAEPAASFRGVTQVVLLESSLSLDRSQHRLPGGREHHEEAVPLGTHLDAFVPGEHRAQDRTRCADRASPHLDPSRLSVSVDPSSR